ncbi:hypothetical protein HUJ04_011333 [Dendroctonus ponderosae]|nr:hypothetical protein HUJ04_011333 [Dendroctonus ponderosae]
MPQTIRLEFAKNLGTPFFPGGPELWHHPLAYSAAAAAAAAAELPGAAALQHATLVHPALHPQVPIWARLSSLAVLSCGIIRLHIQPQLLQRQRQNYRELRHFNMPP